MPEQSFHIEAIGDIYAQALINEANKQNALDAISEDVQGIGELLKTNADFAAFTQSVTISEDKRGVALDRIFTGRVHPLTLHVLKSLSSRDRLMFLAGFVRAFDAIIRKSRGIVEVELVSASPLSDSTMNHIRQIVATNIQGTPEFTTKIDPALIGGITLRVGDILMDGSVVTQLAKMRKSLTRGGTEKLLTSAVLT